VRTSGGDAPATGSEQRRCSAALFSPAAKVGSHPSLSFFLEDQLQFKCFAMVARQLICLFLPSLKSNVGEGGGEGGNMMKSPLRTGQLMSKAEERRESVFEN